MRQSFFAVLGLSLLALTGWSCRIPQRLYTFLPPTNLRNLCESDGRFFYSAVFDICFQYPKNDRWRDVEVSQLKQLPGTSVSEYDFYLTDNNTPQLMFTLYITATGTEGEETFSAAGIKTVYDQSPYLIGVIKSTDIPASLSQDLKQIDASLAAIQVFAKSEAVQ